MGHSTLHVTSTCLARGLTLTLDGSVQVKRHTSVVTSYSGLDKKDSKRAKSEKATAAPPADSAAAAANKPAATPKQTAAKPQPRALLPKDPVISPCSGQDFFQYPDEVNSAWKHPAKEFMPPSFMCGFSNHALTSALARL